MADTQNGRVAVYLDFDNIVISWYDQVHGRNSFGRDRQRIIENPADAEIAARLRAAVLDVGAIIDYASSFGTLVLTRAYADWSSPVNAEYRSQLVARAVDLVQLFPAAAYAKNGADIRLAVDAVEDMFRLEDLSHVVIVGGDSDYVPLAQRCRRLGRYVVGIGVAGSTAKALTAACDEFAMYDSLPGIELPEPVQRASRRGRSRAQSAEGVNVRRRGAAGAPTSAPTSDTTGTETNDVFAPDSGRSEASAEERAPDAVAAVELELGRPEAEDVAGIDSSGARRAGVGSGRNGLGGTDSGGADSGRVDSGRVDSGRVDFDGVDSDTVDPDDADSYDADSDDTDSDDAEIAMTGLLIRALWLGQEKDDSGWLHSSAVKQQMRRMDPSFNEKALGFRSFSDFLKSRSDIAELEESGHERLVRLREQTG